MFVPKRFVPIPEDYNPTDLTDRQKDRLKRIIKYVEEELKKDDQDMGFQKWNRLSDERFRRFLNEPLPDESTFSSQIEDKGGNFR